MMLINSLPGEFKAQFDKLGKSARLIDFVRQLNAELTQGKVKCVYLPNKVCAIIKPVFNQGRLGMLVYAAVSNCKQGLIDHLPWFIDLAKDGDAHFIEFQSKRPGFKRLASTIKFIQTHQRDGFFVYRREV
jgi:hypothetical protein